MYKFVSQDTLYKTFRQYEQLLESELKRGIISVNQARELLLSARANYKNQTLNREIEKINAGNTKESVIHI